MQERHHLVKQQKQEERGSWRLETCGNRETSLDDDDDDNDENDDCDDCDYDDDDGDDDNDDDGDDDDDEEIV